MNKKLLIKIIALVALVTAVVFIWLLIYSRESWKNNLQQTAETDNLNPNLTAQEAADWNAPFMKEIKTEYIDKDELNKMGLANDPNFQLQVLERDANGNVLSYKKINKEEDIIKYIYDPSGAESGGVVETVTNASGTPITN